MELGLVIYSEIWYGMVAASLSRWSSRARTV